MIRDLRDSLAIAADFLEWDLRDKGDMRHQHAELTDGDMADYEAAASRLYHLADCVDHIEPSLLARYAAARLVETDELRCTGPDTIHCSMTMEIGFALDLRTIEDVCRTYIQAVEWARASPRWKHPDADMVEFWEELTKTRH